MHKYSSLIYNSTNLEKFKYEINLIRTVQPSFKLRGTFFAVIPDLEWFYTCGIEVIYQNSAKVNHMMQGSKALSKILPVRNIQIIKRVSENAGPYALYFGH